MLNFFKRKKKREAKEEPIVQLQEPVQKKLIKILSIDGGGIRGIIPAMVLAEIERIADKPISAMFDLIAGSSTGGIIALALVKPGNDGNPKYRAQDTIKIYEKEGKEIFSRTFLHKVKSLGSLTDQKYPALGIESVLQSYFNETMLSEALTDVMITTYDIERRKPFFFKSHYAKDPKRAGYDFLMKKAARSTSAAPTYFEPAKIDIGGLEDYYALIDGGIVANNPAMCAYVEARTMFPDNKPEDFFLLSLGTGSVTRRLPYEEAQGWGLAGWAKPILSAVYDGVSQSVDYQLKQLLSNQRYYRLQAKLDEENDDMDDASSKNIKDLKILAEHLIYEKKETINIICNYISK
jgi:patatin-like phospholipase/acyl hydrolase